MIICPFCTSTSAYIRETKAKIKKKDGKRIYSFFCPQCKSSSFFQEENKDLLCGNILVLVKIATDFMRDTLKEKTYDFETPAIGKYSCIACNGRLTKVSNCKKEKYFFMKCLECETKVFVNRKNFYIYDILP